MGDHFVGPQETIRASAVLSGSYVASNKADLKLFNSVDVDIEVTTSQAGKTANVKPQWGELQPDGTIKWGDEILTTELAASGSEIHQVDRSKVIDVNMESGSATYLGVVKRRFNRQGRFFRMSSKSDGVTTGKIEIRIQPLRN